MLMLPASVMIIIDYEIVVCLYSNKVLTPEWAHLHSPTRRSPGPGLMMVHHKPVPIFSDSHGKVRPEPRAGFRLIIMNIRLGHD